MRFRDKLRSLFAATKVPEALLEDLEDQLIEGDFGAGNAADAIAFLREELRKNRLSGEDAYLRAMKVVLAPWTKAMAADRLEPGLNAILLLGVNGVGKTTTAAKLAAFFGNGLPPGAVILAAADTFRAAATEQLRIHGERLGVKVVGQGRGSDPGAVVFDALQSATAAGARLVVADTAGRMHTKQNLIKELEKIGKVVSSFVAPMNQKRLLVIDATTGRNGLEQARAFSEAVSIDGIILTKADSSARGGIVAAIQREFGIPCAFICSGEGYGDIAAFDPGAYLDELIGKAP